MQSTCLHEPRATKRAGMTHRKSEFRLLLASLVGLGAAVAIGMADPAHGQEIAAEADRPPADSTAEQLRRLDIMLMVTGLRCRTTVDDFQADYGDFTSSHLAELNEAARVMQADLAEQVGERNARLALDKMSVIMANQYGAGHPWASCSELRQVTRDLAHTPGRNALVAAATRLFGPRPAVLAAK